MIKTIIFFIAILLYFQIASFLFPACFVSSLFNQTPYFWKSFKKKFKFASKPNSPDIAEIATHRVCILFKLRIFSLK